MTYNQQDSRYTEKRSIVETLAETLGEGGRRPSFTAPADRRRRRAVRLGGALAALVVMTAIGAIFLRPALERMPPAGEPIARVEVVRGVAMRASGGARASSLLTLAAGEPIHAGAVIETAPAHAASTANVPVDVAGLAAAAGSGGRVALELAGGQSVRLDSDSRVRLASSSELVLERGAVYVDSNDRGSGVEVRTTLGVVRDVGTQFEVRMLGTGSRDSVRVRVREGAIILERGGENHRAAAGAELAVDADGTVTRDVAPRWGEDWNWVLDVAPAPAVAGRPLRDFLAWVEREGGWTVAFADVATADVAARTVLHGDVHELSLAEASTMVLASAGLGYRLKDGTFLVTPGAEGDRAPGPRTP